MSSSHLEPCVFVEDKVLESKLSDRFQFNEDLVADGFWLKESTLSSFMVHK